MPILVDAERLARRAYDGLFRPHGTVDRQWCRLVMNEEISKTITALSPPDSAAVEISGSLHANRAWRSYERLSYPEFDLCSSKPERTYDIVLCEQVLEHVEDPWAAVRTLHRLCRPGGHVVVSTPFLIKVHKEPSDYWRFTADGLRLLLERSGLDVVSVQSWGNRACVRANFKHWVRRRPWNPMQNEETFPMVVWAVARRPHNPPGTPQPEGRA